MKLSFRIATFVCTMCAFQPTVFAATKCDTGFQPYGDVCVSQRMSDYIVCVTATGGNTQEVIDLVSSSIRDNKAGQAKGEGHGVVVGGSGSVVLNRQDEHNIIKKLEKRFFPGGTNACQKPLNLTMSSSKHNLKSKPNALNNLPYLAYTWIHNYSFLYFSKDTKERNISNLDNKLVITNISNRHITNVSVDVFYYNNDNNFENYFKYYDIKSDDYVNIYDVKRPSLPQNAEISIKIKDVINNFFDSAQPEAKEYFLTSLFPVVGGTYVNNIAIAKENEKPSNIFTEDASLLAEKSFVRVADNARGLRLKIVVNYTDGGIRFKDLLVGGLFFYTRGNGATEIAMPAVTDALLKLPYSMWGSVEEVGWQKALAPTKVNFVNNGRQLSNAKNYDFALKPKGAKKMQELLQVTLGRGTFGPTSR